MKKQLSFMMAILAITALLGACGNKGDQSSNIDQSSKNPSTSKSSSSKPSTSEGPKKGVSDLSISLGNDGDKAYITVRGMQQNYTADEFKWAWGLMDRDTSTFDDGKAKPADADFVKVDFDDSNQFTVRYCLTDVQTIKAGKMYRIYGGTPETYGDIAFASNMFGASDATRKYYLRQDLENSLTFDNVQPISFATAEVVDIASADLPTGITNPGAYLKISGANSKNLTKDQIDAWNDAGNIAGDFQRVIPSWQSHPHTADERFWKIEGNNVCFYLYCGFLEVDEGWMVHFDLVSGNQGAGLYTTTTYNGETTYTTASGSFKVYSNQTSDEEHYWGCVGVYRAA